MACKIRLKVSSGKGGSGCLSFASSRRKIRGGPDGGNGGSGGDVWIRAASSKTSLSHLKTNKIYQAGSGRPGGPRRKTGRKGENLIIEVPPCTWLKTKNIEILISEEEPYLLLKGGARRERKSLFQKQRQSSPRQSGALWQQPDFGNSFKGAKTKHNMRKKIGILGGSFDPPHKGHRWIIETCIRQLDLNAVYIIPSCQTPHKKPLSDRP